MVLLSTWLKERLLEILHKLSQLLKPKPNLKLNLLNLLLKLTPSQACLEQELVLELTPSLEWVAVLEVSLECLACPVCLEWHQEVVLLVWVVLVAWTPLRFKE
jgi:hypothetical protein